MRAFIVGLVLFSLGLIGVFYNRHDLIKLIISLEVLLMSLVYLFVMASLILDDIVGLSFAVIILAVAACESVVGLAIMIDYFRICDNLSIEGLVLIQG